MRGTGRRAITNLGCIIRGTEDQLWGSVVARAYVGHVWFVLNQNFGGSKVAQFQDTGGGVKKQVLRLDITVTDAL
jgi:hypothetical protein